MFCGSTMGRSARWRGCSRLLMCADCQAAYGHGAGPYPMMTRAQMRADLELLPTWALEQKAAANRQVIAVMRRRLAAGEEVARMYQEPGLAWLERQAEVAEDLDEGFHHNRLSLIASIGAWGAPAAHHLEPRVAHGPSR